MDGKVRLGIAGSGRIVHRVMKDLAKAEHIDIRAIASRNGDRAAAVARELCIPEVYDSYESMAASDDIDLVYVAVPHTAHRYLTELFLNNGKHVIAEKPFAINTFEAASMIACAGKNGRFLMEAMWTRFFPAVKALKADINSGKLGDISFITGDFAYRSAYDPSDRVFDINQGGGSLLDVGVYPLSMMCCFKGSVPTDVRTVCRKTPGGVDSMCAFQALWDDGCAGQGFAATDVTTGHTMHIYGTKARAELPDFWHPHTYTITYADGSTDVRTFDKDNEGFWREFEYAAECILNGRTGQDVIPLDETLKIMDIMTGMRADMDVRYPGEEVPEDDKA